MLPGGIHRDTSQYLWTASFDGFSFLLMHELAHAMDHHYGVTGDQYLEGGSDPVADWWEARQYGRADGPQFVSEYASTNVLENFAETFVAWAALRSGRLNPVAHLRTLADRAYQDRRDGRAMVESGVRMS